MAEITIQQLEQEAAERGLSVWQILDEIVEKEINER